MKAFRIEAEGKLGRGSVVEMPVEALDEGGVLVRVHYAGINYKDALAGLAGGPIVRRYPCNGGIDAAGVVESSDDARFSPGDAVVCHGRGIGVSHDGGLAEYLRVPADWLLPLSAPLTPKAAATLGVAGYSAALAIDRLQSLGVTTGGLPVAVSGATGGVGAFAVAMLAGLGFEVTAISSKPGAAGWLKELGASDICALADLDDKPMGRARWCGGVDAAGGAVLAGMLAACDRDGVIANMGNAAGVELHTTVLPFILRGITLSGINADSDTATRRRIWARMADDLCPKELEDWASVVTLDEVLPAMQRMLDNKAKGRTIVDPRRDGTA